MRKLGIREFRLNCTSDFENHPAMITNHGTASFFVIPSGANFVAAVKEAESINNFYSSAFGGGGAGGTSEKSTNTKTTK